MFDDFLIFPAKLHHTIWLSLHSITEILLAVLVATALIYSRILSRRIEEQKILNYFATSLFGKNTVEDVFWDIAKNCISKLHLQDCIIYLVDNKRQVLIQIAAFGPKNPHKYEILNPIEILLGKGIVGSVAITGKAEIVRDTEKDSRYIIDDVKRLSEITVPIIVEGEVFGVIDSEHSRKNFFKSRHLQLLVQIAGICSEKISKYLLEEKLRSNIASDLHDEIGSALTSINILSKIALEQQSDTGLTHDYLNKIKIYSSNIMEGMTDIVWAINPANDNVASMLYRMKEFALEILEPLKINVCFKEDEAIAQVKLPLSQRKEVYLIFKEAITNIAKYSNATKVTVSIAMHQNKLQLLISNNGKGFDTSIIYPGNGLHNMQKRAKQINASFNINSLINNGTTINLTVPIA